jgi:membrane associated rhomboid family serine protease
MAMAAWRLAERHASVLDQVNRSGFPLGGLPGGGRTRVVFGGGSLTPGIKALIVGCTALFLVQFIEPSSLVEHLFGLSAQGVFERFWIWQPLSYLFLHSTSSILHLVFNMLMLWMFGTELEARWGTSAFLRYYFIAGVGAGLTSLLVDVVAAWFGGGPLPDIPTIGASGAIYGLLAAQAILFPERRILFLLLFPMRMRPAVALMVALTLFSAVSASAGSAVNEVAHLGGFVFGWAYLRRAWNLKRLWHDWRWRLRRRRYRVLTDIRDDDRYRFH